MKTKMIAVVGAIAALLVAQTAMAEYGTGRSMTGGAGMTEAGSQEQFSFEQRDQMVNKFGDKVSMMKQKKDALNTALSELRGASEDNWDQAQRNAALAIQNADTSVQGLGKAGATTGAAMRQTGTVSYQQKDTLINDIQKRVSSLNDGIQKMESEMSKLKNANASNWDNVSRDAQKVKGEVAQEYMSNTGVGRQAQAGRTGGQSTSAGEDQTMGTTGSSRSTGTSGRSTTSSGSSGMSGQSSSSGMTASNMSRSGTGTTGMCMNASPSGTGVTGMNAGNMSRSGTNTSREQDIDELGGSSVSGERSMLERQ